LRDVPRSEGEAPPEDENDEEEAPPEIDLEAPPAGDKETEMLEDPANDAEAAMLEDPANDKEAELLEGEDGRGTEDRMDVAALSEG
jgi:hypothetical protein